MFQHPCLHRDTKVVNLVSIWIAAPLGSISRGLMRKISNQCPIKSLEFSMLSGIWTGRNSHQVLDCLGIFNLGTTQHQPWAWWAMAHGIAEAMCRWFCRPWRRPSRCCQWCWLAWSSAGRDTPYEKFVWPLGIEVKKIFILACGELNSSILPFDRTLTAG